MTSTVSLFAQRSIGAAKKMVEKGEYESASKYFDKLDPIGQYDPELIKTIAFCNSKCGKYEKAEYWLAKLIRDEKPVFENYVLYFNALVNLGKYQQSYDLIKNFENKVFNKKDIDQMLKLGDFWKNHTLNSSLNKVCLLPFNSKLSELAPTIKGDKLYYSIIQGCEDGLIEEKELVYQPFMSEILSDSLMTDGGKLKGKLNCFGDNVYVNYSRDGRFVFCSKINRNTKFSEMFWGNSDEKYLKNLTKFTYNNKRYSVGRASLSPDGKLLVFSSNMPNSKGEFDLWSCKFKNGNWSIPENLGDSINTSGIEAMPYFVTNTKLCFASDGHIGFGRFDLYYTEWKGDHFSSPVNMGSPVNTQFNEIGICYSEKFDQYYFASDRGGDFDIYSYKKMNQKPNIPLKVDEVEEPKAMEVFDPDSVVVPESVVSESTSMELASDEDNTNPMPDVEVQPTEEHSEYFYTIQIMALGTITYKKQLFKEVLLKQYDYFVVKENNQFKIRTGHFPNYQRAFEYVKKEHFNEYYIVRMLKDQPSEEL